MIKYFHQKIGGNQAMMGIKAYQEKLFYNFSLSKRVSEDHILRKVDTVIDLRFVRTLVADTYSHTGQPSTDPEVIFRMMLIGYLYGITSERRLAEDVSLNMAYMWFIGYDLEEPTPHHSVFSKARARYGKEVFEQFFHKILEQCIAQGLVKGEKVFMDSTYIQANASLKSIVPRQDAIEPHYSSKEYVDKVFSENPVEDTKTSQVKEHTEPMNEITATKQSKKYSNKTHVSKTDTDASIIGRSQGKPLQLTYKEHFTIDADQRIITSVAVTEGAVGDEAKAQDLVQQQPVPIKEICADTKYGTYDNYKFLYEHDIIPIIPPFITKHKNTSDFFNKNKFIYDEQTDTYLCPGGKQLRKSTDAAPKDYIAYTSEKSDCMSCPLRHKCFNAKRCKRIVIRHKYEHFRDQAIAYFQTTPAQETMRQRKYYAEWVNAESKTKHGLRRAMFRGLDNVTIQVFMTASVQNIKRLIANISADTPNGSVFKELYIQFCYSLHFLQKLLAFA